VPATPDGQVNPGVALFAADRAARAHGIELVSVGEGRAQLRMRVTDAMVNGHGSVHGGLIFLLADAAFGCACNSYGPATVAAGAEISFVAPAGAGDELVATAVARTRFGRNGIYDVTVERVDGDARQTVAEFRGRSRSRSSAEADP
jgi:acyl-CoA thioesterase